MEELFFHRSLYSPASVRAAAERFSKLCNVMVEEEAEVIRVVVNEVPERLRDRLRWELGNHALFQTIVDAREGA